MHIKCERFETHPNHYLYSESSEMQTQAYAKRVSIWFYESLMFNKNQTGKKMKRIRTAKASIRIFGSQ